MKTTLLFCESAAIHQDGSWSLLRVFYDEFRGPPKGKFLLKATILLIIESAAEDAGSHGILVQIKNSDGDLIFDPEVREHTFPSGENRIIASWEVVGPIAKQGVHKLEVMIDGQVVDSWMFRALRESTDDPSAPTYSWPAQFKK